MTEISFKTLITHDKKCEIFAKYLAWIDTRYFCSEKILSYATVLKQTNQTAIRHIRYQYIFNISFH